MTNIYTRTVTLPKTPRDGKFPRSTGSGAVSNNTGSGGGITLPILESDVTNLVTDLASKVSKIANYGLVADTEITKLATVEANANYKTHLSQLYNDSGFITGIDSTMVSNALGFYPYSASNPNGYISGINSTQVTNALGYTPYNSSNPAGYLSSISSGNVTTALGYTPYNATNPAGYITNSALSGYSTTSHNHTGVYQPLATVLTNTTASYTTTDASKLAGIAAGATNVTYTSQITNNSGYITSASLSGYAPLASPTFTGTVTAPTADITVVHLKLYGSTYWTIEVDGSANLVFKNASNVVCMKLTQSGYLYTKDDISAFNTL